MKISRDGNKITLEVGPEDCAGQPLEIVADFVYEGMLALTDPEVWAETISKLESIPLVMAKLGEATKRLYEKWEIVPPPAER